MEMARELPLSSDQEYVKIITLDGKDVTTLDQVPHDATVLALVRGTKNDPQSVQSNVALIVNHFKTRPTPS